MGEEGGKVETEGGEAKQVVISDGLSALAVNLGLKFTRWEENKLIHEYVRMKMY